MDWMIQLGVWGRTQHSQSFLSQITHQKKTKTTVFYFIFCSSKERVQVTTYL
jgi:hypothetical protein